MRISANVFTVCGTSPELLCDGIALKISHGEIPHPDENNRDANNALRWE
jgi:hypothetical protein